MIRVGTNVVFGITLFMPSSFAHAAPPVPNTFRVHGTITSPWDTLFADVLIPRNRVAVPDEQALNTVTVENNIPYVFVPRTEITFRNNQNTTTVAVDDKGSYAVDL